MSTTLELNALREDNPRDFLAALGLLRLWDSQWPETATQLSWPGDPACARLTIHGHVPSNWGVELWNRLRGWQAGDPNPFGLGAVNGLTDARIRELLTTFRDGEPLVRLVAALAAQIELPRVQRRSDLLIESGQRQVLRGVNNLLRDEELGNHVESSFLDPGMKPAPVANTSRWNPAEFRAAAHTTTDPAGTVFFDIPVFNVFALFGLTFYPVLDHAGGKATSGFRRTKDGREFSWPIWGEPLRTNAIATLLLHGLIHQPTADSAEGRRLGVERIWRSRKFGDTNNQYFSPARPGF